MAVRLKCPYCGKELKSDDQLKAMMITILKDMDTTIVASVQAPPLWIRLTNKVIEAISGDQKKLEEANKWIDIKCQKCSKTYQYNIETQEVKL